MSTYRPRLTEVVQCKQCHKPFETRHRRATYCTDSCRQMAYQARNHVERPKPASSEGLRFSANDLGVIAAGTAVTTLGNYFLNDKPAQQTLLEKMVSLEKGTEQGLNQLISAAQMMVDFINAQAQTDPTLGRQLQHVKAKRLADKQHLKELKADTVDKLLAKRGLKGG